MEAHLRTFSYSHKFTDISWNNGEDGLRYFVLCKDRWMTDGSFAALRHDMSLIEKDGLIDSRKGLGAVHIWEVSSWW